jgi:hypothetical protein
MKPWNIFGHRNANNRVRRRRRQLVQQRGAFRRRSGQAVPGVSEFQQGNNSVTCKKGGTGLGLTISKRNYRDAWGRIWIESVVGQGSTFSFTLLVIANN